jgi:hypothetical protein
MRAADAIGAYAERRARALPALRDWLGAHKPA